jgi:SAM-dependent methyltransferase
MPTTAAPHQIREDFDAIAAVTPRTEHLGPYEEWLLTNLPPTRGTVLEVGCGVGRLARRLAGEFERVVAIDFSEGMISEAKRRTADGAVDYVCADLFEWLKEHPDWYDCIVSVGTLHHVDLGRALEQMARALKAGGRLIVLDLLERKGFVINAFAWVVARLRDVLERRIAWKLRRAFWRHGRHERYLTLEEVREAVLPGSRVRERLLFRYSIVWDKAI